MSAAINAVELERPNMRTITIRISDSDYASLIRHESDPNRMGRMLVAVERLEGFTDRELREECERVDDQERQEELLAMNAREQQSANPKQRGNSATITTSTLSLAASAIWQLANAHAYGAPLDALFDGGEWSAAAHQRDEANEQEEIARRFGFKHAVELWDAIEERTSPRWMHFNFPPPLADDEFEHHSIHGRNRNH